MHWCCEPPLKLCDCGCQLDPLLDLHHLPLLACAIVLVHLSPCCAGNHCAIAWLLVVACELLLVHHGPELNHCVKCQLGFVLCVEEGGCVDGLPVWVHPCLLHGICDHPLPFFHQACGWPSPGYECDLGILHLCVEAVLLHPCCANFELLEFHLNFCDPVAEMLYHWDDIL